MKPRNRVVVFRLTQDEYERLKDASFAKGARSLSDFTRSELLGESRSDSRSDSLHEVLQDRFKHVERKLRDLEALLRHLARHMEGVAIIVLDEQRKAS